jgi:hypothetical protein
VAAKTSMRVGGVRLGLIPRLPLLLVKRSSQCTVPYFQVFGRIRLGWPTTSLMHVLRVDALKKALVLAVDAVASMGAIPSSRNSGAVATPWAFAPTLTRRLTH